MATLTDALYNYLQENRLNACWADPEFRRLSQSQSSREQALREKLSPDGVQRLEQLLAAQDDIGFYQQRAIMRAAIALGLELARF